MACDPFSLNGSRRRSAKRGSKDHRPMMRAPNPTCRPLLHRHQPARSSSIHMQAREFVVHSNRVNFKDACRHYTGGGASGNLAAMGSDRILESSQCKRFGSTVAPKSHNGHGGTTRRNWNQIQVTRSGPHRLPRPTATMGQQGRLQDNLLFINIGFCSVTYYMLFTIILGSIQFTP
jgi:hypothetical protein